MEKYADNATYVMRENAHIPFWNEGGLQQHPIETSDDIQSFELST